MLDRNRVLHAFEQKRDQLETFLSQRQQQSRTIEEILALFSQDDFASLMSWLNERGDEPAGALPTPELDQTERLYLPFAQQWNNHRAAREWAMSILQNRPVLAVDGSQIVPTKEFSIPVAAVQIGWFLNEHAEGKPYEKDVAFELLGPLDLIDDGDDIEESRITFSEWRVNQERFLRECDTLCQRMATYADRPPQERPICFFDGSFIISFAVHAKNFTLYVEAVDKMLHSSRVYGVPLVGFVDTSQSSDVMRLLCLRTESQLVANDARLFNRLIAPTEWGARSTLFYCDRKDTLNSKKEALFYNDVAFTYMRLNRDRSPARIEMPRWLVEEERADEILDIVRAECIVGSGYPYVIETADAVAVIGQQDRQRFYALFQQFAENELNTQFTQSRKQTSKQGRR